jgi:hypothetical protein
MNDVVSGVITVATAIVGVAILAVLVSNRANTAGVIKAASSGFAQSIGAAVSPVTGSGGGGGGILSPTMFTGGGPVGDLNYF